MTSTAIGIEPVIRVRGLVKRYGDVKAVDGIDFQVAAGEVFGLLGPNGAGKTTTVEILEGLRSPDGGEAFVLGVDVAKGADSLKPRIGVSLQTAALYPKLTVVEVLDLFRSFYPRSRPTDELIADLELGERRNAQTRELSGGQRQRLAVALALVNDPELIFLDEPTTGLDPAARRSLCDLVRGLKAAGRSVLLTTHYMEEAEGPVRSPGDHGPRPNPGDMGTVDELISKRFKERAVRFDRIDALGSYFVPSMLGLSVMQVGIFAAIPLVADREKLILKRLAATPLRRWQLVGSNILMRLLIALIQAVIIIGVGVVMGAMTFLALGYVIASFASTEDAANGMTSVIQFPMMFLSGTFFSIDQMPDVLKVVARVIPLTYLSDALRQVMVGGAAFAPLWVCFLVLAGWLVVCFAIAARKFRWQ